MLRSAPQRSTKGKAPGISQGKDIKLAVYRFADSSIEIRIYFWTGHMAEANAAKSDIIIKINAVLAFHGIAIPFPKRDIQVTRSAKPL
ncbi:hypothetical protein [Pedobacter sp. SYP-B3415]|uniref:hypothetical protein n=1 Tax=Pedobacter sp. SYP-B3415 TaxID=2496641 RepID=UPI00351921DF